MKKFAFLFCAVAAVLFLAACESSPKGYSVVDGVIVFDAPARAEGQHSVLRLTTDPMPVVRVGFIGLGMRGPGAVERFTYLDGVEIKALCDLYPDRVEKSQEILAGRNLPAAAAYSGEEGWKEPLPARRHRPRLYLHPVAAACADGGLRHGARQARGRGGSRRHVARRVLAAGQYRRKDPAPLHDARKLRLRLFRA